MSGTYKTTDYVTIVDIDGTLADCEHRVHFITDKKQAKWFDFFSAIHEDSLIESTLELVWKHFYQGNKIWCVSGRPTFASEEGKIVPVADMTTVWLQKYRVPFERLFMRVAEDYRSDEIVKPEILVHQILPNINVNQIVTAIDDRPRVIAVWRALGLHVTDVGKGIDF